MRLYEISAQLRAALDAAAESEDQSAWADTLEGLEGDFETKAIKVAAYIKELEADAHALAAESVALASRSKAKGAYASRLRGYLQANMEAAGKTKIEGTEAVLQVRANGGKVPLIIDDEAAIPGHWKHTEEVWSVDKENLRAYLEAGRNVPGARLGERGKRLEIK